MREEEKQIHFYSSFDERKMTKHDEWRRWDGRRVIPGISEFVTAPKQEIFLDGDTFMDLSTRKQASREM